MNHNILEIILFYIFIFILGFYLGMQCYLDKISIDMNITTENGTRLFKSKNDLFPKHEFEVRTYVKFVANFPMCYCSISKQDLRIEENF